MSNFKFLLSDPAFAPFMDVAVAAEKILHINPAASILNCRRAMEFAVKWMYSVDKELEMPYQDNLQSLMGREEFRAIVGPDLWRRMDYIRVKGNNVAHNSGKASVAAAMLCLENLHIFLDFVAYCYANEYTETKFDPALVPQAIATEQRTVEDAGPYNNVDMQKLIEENKALKEQLTARREEQQTYVPKPLDISEYETRKFYIDAMLEDAGWTEGKDWLNEVELPGMPNKSEVGYADYVGEFVREIVGLDMNAAKEAFAEFLNDTSLDSNQIYFVNQIVEYIVHNGLMKDLSVLQDAPFTDNGSIVEVFTDLTVWLGVKRIIDKINANALAA